AGGARPPAIAWSARRTRAQDAIASQVTLSGKQDSPRGAEVRVGDPGEGVVARHLDACAGALPPAPYPGPERFQLLRARRDHRPGGLDAVHGIERHGPTSDEHAEAQERATPDAVLAVDEHPGARVDSLPDPLHPLVDHLRRDGAAVFRGEMQELEAVDAQRRLVVAGLHPDVHDATDPLPTSQLLRGLHRKAAAHREPLVDPVEVEGQTHRPDTIRTVLHHARRQVSAARLRTAAWRPTADASAPPPGT